MKSIILGGLHILYTSTINMLPRNSEWKFIMLIHLTLNEINNFFLSI